MNTRREKSPYPKYLYRYMAPQYEGSVQNLIEIESDAYTESDCYNIGSGNTDGTLSSFFEELEFQLSKYQNQLKGQRSNYDCALVSLSGDFRWVVQKAAKIYYSPHKKECPGVAIVETARATADDCFVWRVSDLFDYFDTIFELDNPYCSASFSRSIRYWADNAHEYVVWSHVPRRAMVSFVPASMLAPPDQPNFLTKEFRRARDLAKIRDKRHVKLSNETYWDMAIDFVSLFITHQPWNRFPTHPGYLDVDVLLATMRCPRQWGYFCFMPTQRRVDSYEPETELLTDYRVTANMSQTWHSSMVDVEENLKESAISAMQDSRDLGKETRKQPGGPHHMRCSFCKWEPR
jgi:hypothetical protein